MNVACRGLNPNRAGVAVERYINFTQNSLINTISFQASGPATLQVICDGMMIIQLQSNFMTQVYVPVPQMSQVYFHVCNDSDGPIEYAINVNCSTVAPQVMGPEFSSDPVGSPGPYRVLPPPVPLFPLGDVDPEIARRRREEAEIHGSQMRNEYLRRELEQRARLDESNERAWTLAAEVMGADTAARLKRGEDITIVAGNGNTYELQSTGTVINRTTGERYCVVIEGGSAVQAPLGRSMPIADQLLIKYLYLTQAPEVVERVVGPGNRFRGE